MGQWVTVAVSIGLVVTGVAGLVFNLRELLRARASLGWPKAQAEVLAVSVEERRVARGGIRFEPVVRYRYVHDGVARESTRLAFGSVRVADRDEADRVAAQLSIGSRGFVRVCPTKPTTAVLVPGPNGFIWFGIAFFIIYGAVAVFLMVDVTGWTLR